MKPNNFWHKGPLWQAAGEGAPSGEAVAAADPATPAAPDLSFIPADFHVDGKPDLAKFAEHYTGLTAAEKARAEAASAVPEAYDFALPKDLKFEGLDLPEGFTFEMKPDDPMFAPLYAEAGALLKEIGAPGEAAGRLAAVLAKYEAAKFVKDHAEKTAKIKALHGDMASLGTPVQQQARLDTVERLLETRLPKDQVEALKFVTMSAKALMAMETLLGPKSTTPLNVPPTASVENDLKNHYANPKR